MCALESQLRVEELDCKLCLKVQPVWPQVHFSVKLPISCGMLIHSVWNKRVSLLCWNIPWLFLRLNTKPLSSVQGHATLESAGLEILKPQSEQKCPHCGQAPGNSGLSSPSHAHAEAYLLNAGGKKQNRPHCSRFSVASLPCAPCRLVYICIN